MKIEFEDSIPRLSFLCYLPDIKIAWINPWIIQKLFAYNKYWPKG